VIRIVKQVLTWLLLGVKSKLDETHTATPIEESDISLLSFNPASMPAVEVQTKQLFITVTNSDPVIRQPNNYCLSNTTFSRKISSKSDMWS